MPQPATDYSVALIPGPWEHQFIAANGSRFHAALAGPTSGSLVVLLHGFGQFWWAWREVIPALADAGYRVAALDLRGVAASDKPPTGYDIPTRTRDIAAIIRSLGHREATVIGHGTGGEAAWAMGALQPAVTTAIGALACPHPARMHTTFLKGLTPQARRWFALAQLPTLPEHLLRNTDALAQIFASGHPAVSCSGRLSSGSLEPRPSKPPEVARTTPRRSSAVPVGRVIAFRRGEAQLYRDHGETAAQATPFLPEVLDKYREVIRIPFAAHTTVEAMRWLVRSAPRPDGLRYRSALRRPLTIPALQIQGMDDGLIRPEVANVDSAALFRNLTYHQIEGAGHYLLEEQPNLIATQILTWLTQAT